MVRKVLTESAETPFNTVNGIYAVFILKASDQRADDNVVARADFSNCSYGSTCLRGVAEDLRLGSRSLKLERRLQLYHFTVESFL